MNRNGNPIIRLMYDSPLGYHRQLALGQDVNATNGIDIGYDSYLADINEEDMYWIIDSYKFVIQGVNNFDDTQEFPLGLIVNGGGLVRIRLDGIENLDPNKDIYIKDTTTNQTFQINTDPFEISLPTGVYDDRFRLVFRSESLSIDEVDLKDDYNFYFDLETSEVKIIRPKDINILDASLYNIIGQRIMKLDFNSGMTSEPINVISGVYIVKLNTANGVISKKIIVE